MAEYKGIDVSKHQGVIDWNKVKAAGIQFAIVRLGWSWYEGGINVDSQFINNVTNANKAGVPVGCYLYSYDQSVAAAKIGAAKMMEVVKKYDFQLPIVIDQEYEQFNLKAGKKLNTDIVLEYLKLFESENYYAMIYASMDYFNNYLDLSRLSNFDKWCAQYASKCTFTGGHNIWQYSSTGKVNGINGNVDMNIAYVDYPSIIKSKGLNKPKTIITPPDTKDYKALYEAELKKNTALENSLTVEKQNATTLNAKITKAISALS